MKIRKRTSSPLRKKGAEPAVLERWFSAESDVRIDAVILQEIADFLDEHEVKSVVMTDRLIGCPHEEGIDYPEGTVNPPEMWMLSTFRKQGLYGKEMFR